MDGLTVSILQKIQLVKNLVLLTPSYDMAQTLLWTLHFQFIESLKFYQDPINLEKISLEYEHLLRYVRYFFRASEQNQKLNSFVDSLSKKNKALWQPLNHPRVHFNKDQMCLDQLLRIQNIFIHKYENPENNPDLQGGFKAGQDINGLRVDFLIKEVLAIEIIMVSDVLFDRELPNELAFKAGVLSDMGYIYCPILTKDVFNLTEDQL